MLRRSSIADLETQSPTLATTVVWPSYLVLRVSIRTLVVGPEAGFWPVISNPSAAETEQLVLDQERHDLGEADIRLLTVDEPGHLLSLWLAGGGLDMTQDAGGMADQRHRLPGQEERTRSVCRN